jgi:hypothetical protein
MFHYIKDDTFWIKLIFYFRKILIILKIETISFVFFSKRTKRTNYPLLHNNCLSLCATDSKSLEFELGHRTKKMAKSNNKEEPSTAPQPERWYNLALGPSVKDHHSSSKFCTLRCKSLHFQSNPFPGFCLV